MKVIDSSGWVEFAAGGSLAERYEAHLREHSKILTPSIVVYEVYKRLKRDASEAAANAIVAEMGKTRIIPLDDQLALRAADVSLTHGLPMADAIVYATAQAYEAILITCDADFKELPQVTYLKK